MDLWTKNAISRIASTLGKPIKMDNNTANELRLQFARVLVEIDANFQFPTVVKGILSNGNNIDISISYEYKPKTCDTCKVFGHCTRNCVLSLQQKWRPKETTGTVNQKEILQKSATNINDMPSRSDTTSELHTQKDKAPVDTFNPFSCLSSDDEVEECMPSSSNIPSETPVSTPALNTTSKNSTRSGKRGNLKTNEKTGNSEQYKVGNNEFVNSDQMFIDEIANYIDEIGMQEKVQVNVPHMLCDNILFKLRHEKPLNPKAPPKRTTRGTNKIK